MSISEGTALLETNLNCRILEEETEGYRKNTRQKLIKKFR